MQTYLRALPVLPLRLTMPIAGLFVLSTLATAQSNWIDYVDQTATRVVGSAAAIADTYEKDMLAVDLDLDGDDDLVVVRKVPYQFIGGHTNVLFMNEGGVLVERTNELIPSFNVVDNSRDVIAPDVNGDGWPDLVVAETIYESPRMWLNLGVDGNNNFLGFTEFPAGLATLDAHAPKFCAVSASDVDGDGDLDLYFSDYRNFTEDRLLMNDGNGIFTDETATRLSLEAAASLFVINSWLADFDGDGWDDIIKVEDGGLDILIVYNDGAGNFTDIQALDTFITHHAVPVDFDNDGRLDVYVVDDFQDYLFHNLGPDGLGQVSWAQLPVAASSRVDGEGGNAVAQDFDQDGYMDIIVAGVDYIFADCSRELALLRNGTGDVGSVSVEDPNEGQSLPWNVQGVHDMVFMDLDDDGFMDMVLGTCTGIEVWRKVPFSIPGNSYCVANPNSTGNEAEISAHGSTSLAANDFSLIVDGGVPGEFGIFFYGPNQIQAPFGNGVRCIGGTTNRLLPSIKMGTPTGLGARAVDFTAAPANMGPGAIGAGSTWNFQFWYRDPAAGGAFFNLSNGLQVSFGL